MVNTKSVFTSVRTIKRKKAVLPVQLLELLISKVKAFLHLGNLFNDSVDIQLSYVTFYRQNCKCQRRQLALCQCCTLVVSHAFQYREVSVTMSFGTEKLEWCGDQMVKINLKICYIRFDRMYERDRHTDGQTYTA